MCRAPNCDRKVAHRGLCIAHYRRDLRGLSLDVPAGTKNGACLEFTASLIGTKETECIYWPFTKSGWPTVTYNGRKMLASRYLCTQIYGVPAEGMEAAHSCGKGHLGCVNPNHLRWATHVENEADKVLHGTRIQGSKHVKAKLTEQEVISIRNRVVNGEGITALAREYGVSHSLISCIVSRKKWKHI